MDKCSAGETVHLRVDPELHYQIKVRALDAKIKIWQYYDKIIKEHLETAKGAENAKSDSV